jgi:hypothetical protein
MLIQPTNIVQALTFGTETGLKNGSSTESMYSHINSITRHSNSKLNQINSLGLKKGSDGRYYYTL